MLIYLLAQLVGCHILAVPILFALARLLAMCHIHCTLPPCVRQPHLLRYSIPVLSQGGLSVHLFFFWLFVRKLFVFFPNPSADGARRFRGKLPPKSSLGLLLLLLFFLSLPSNASTRSSSFPNFSTSPSTNSITASSPRAYTARISSRLINSLGHKWLNSLNLFRYLLY